SSTTTATATITTTSSNSTSSSTTTATATITTTSSNSTSSSTTTATATITTTSSNSTSSSTTTATATITTTSSNSTSSSTTTATATITTTSSNSTSSSTTTATATITTTSSNSTSSSTTSTTNATTTTTSTGTSSISSSTTSTTNATTTTTGTSSASSSTTNAATTITSTSITSYIITSTSTTAPTTTTQMISSQSSTTTTTAAAGFYCVNSTHILLVNSSCVLKADAQQSSYNILLNDTVNATTVGANLINYFESVANVTSTNSSYILTLNRVDQLVNNLNSTSFTVNGTSSFLLVQTTSQNQSDDVLVLGASFSPDAYGQVVNTQNRESIISSNISSAAIVSNDSIVNVKSMSIFIIDNPSLYKNVDNSTNDTLVISSLIVASVKNFPNRSSSVKIALYFTPALDSPQPSNGTFLCSFYDTSMSRWNSSGCSSPTYNSDFKRYECSCNHTTSFALIWLPSGVLASSGRNFRSADTASLICQSLSIACILGILLHAAVNRVIHPSNHISATIMLPLISYASTGILFVFYIALTMTVYTRTTSENETQCFLSSRVLMFFTYFFLIFMLCIKTSIGYFNYLRFVQLFPPPSYRRLFVLLLISLILAGGWVAFAAGFDSNPSYNITQLYPYRFCWFTHTVIYYFLTIPVAIFLLLTFINIIYVGKRMIEHVQRATSPHHTYQRMKQCVLVLIASSITQGVGWLFGPFLSFVSPSGASVLEWFFIIFNALEGVWAVLAYLVIRAQIKQEQIRVTTVKKWAKEPVTVKSRPKESNSPPAQKGTGIETSEFEPVRRKRQNDPIQRFDDLRDTN
ncbi:unnamed protein product, partial [Adineta ricciae]